MIHPERRRENLKKIEEMDKQDALISRRQAVSRMSDLICLELKGKCPTWNDVYKAMNELPTVETERLKEQEAVSITTDYFDGFGNRTSHCPSCNSRLVWHQNKNYCGECGRKVNWDDCRGIPGAE